MKQAREFWTNPGLRKNAVLLLFFVGDIDRIRTIAIGRVIEIKQEAGKITDVILDTVNYYTAARYNRGWHTDGDSKDFPKILGELSMSKKEWGLVVETYAKRARK